MKKSNSQNDERLQPGDLELMGFEFCRDLRNPTTGRLGMYVYSAGDEERAQILAAIDDGSFTIAKAKANYAARVARSARMGEPS